MRTTTLYLEDSAESVTRMSAPIPDDSTSPSPAALAAARGAATEAAWGAFERATFPDLNR